MPRPKLPDRVVGVYPERGRWRLIAVVEGIRITQHFASESEARQASRKLEGELNAAPQTVGALAEEFVRGLGSSPTSQKSAIYQLHAALSSLWTAPPTVLTRPAVEAAYREVCSPTRSRPFAVATQYTILGRLSSFCRWLVKRRILRADPSAELEPQGTPRRGKPQLTVDEARRLLPVLLRGERRTDIALATLLLLGCRASEVRLRVPRDIDEDGTVLVIPSGKTQAAARRLLLPDILRPLLAELATAPQDGFLFGEISNGQLTHRLKRHLNALNLPMVCLHSLRGLHATIARSAGATGQVVAAQLGHTSEAVTRAHYYQPGTVERVEQRAVLRVLTGGK